MKTINNFTKLCVLLLLMISVSMQTWAVVFAGGTGTQDAPYLIETVDQLKGIQTTLKTGKCIYFKLAADIDLKGQRWIPFNQTAPYTKEIYFDGDGHTISNLNCTNQTYCSFAGVLNGTVCNVHFLDASVRNSGNNSHIGIVAGYVGISNCRFKGVVENVWVEGGVNNNSISSYAGGICGFLACGRVSNCIANVDVVSATVNDLGTGGICGYQYDGENLKEPTEKVNTLLKNCLFTGTVNSPRTHTGGILGKSENRYGNYISGNICAATMLRGNTNDVGFIMGRCYDGYLDKAGCVSQNMSSAHTKIYFGDANAFEGKGAKAFDEDIETEYKEKTRTLLNTVGWKTKQLRDGCKYYNFENFDVISGANQIVNVLEVDITSGRYKLDFAYENKADTLSEFIKRRQRAGIDVVGGINANYELQSIYIRNHGVNVVTPTISDTDVKWWKHEGAILGYSDGEVKIRLSDRNDGHQALKNYDQSRAKDIIASAPTLIENFKNMGSSFVNQQRYNEQGNKLDYEDKDRHQGVRHPRTAVALTDDGDLLLITVDGRFTGKAEGMTANELTRFIDKYFHPQYALNLDGGGSTTMCVTGYGDKETNVVNYPCDNNTFNHWGQRAREAHLIIEECEDVTAESPAPNELGQQHDSHFGLVFLSTVSDAARQIGWDETIWDLTAEMPQLKTFAENETGAKGVVCSRQLHNNQVFDVTGRTATKNAMHGVYIENGIKKIKLK